MMIFQWIVGVLFGAVLLAALARRVGAPYPVFLALGGIAFRLRGHGEQHGRGERGEDQFLGHRISLPKCHKLIISRLFRRPACGTPREEQS